MDSDQQVVNKELSLSGRLVKADSLRRPFGVHRWPEIGQISKVGVPFHDDTSFVRTGSGTGPPRGGKGSKGSNLLLEPFHPRGGPVLDPVLISLSHQSMVGK